MLRLRKLTTDGVYEILIDVVVRHAPHFLYALKCIFVCEAHMIDYGHTEYKNLRTRLFSMAFFVNLLISQKTVIFENGINKRGPEYLKLRTFVTAQYKISKIEVSTFVSSFFIEKYSFQDFDHKYFEHSFSLKVILYFCRSYIANL